MAQVFQIRYLAKNFWKPGHFTLLNVSLRILDSEKSPAASEQQPHQSTSAL
jgi:hypothetical protein